MDESDILHKIIREGCNPGWVTPNICKACPLSKLKMKPDGNWFSCIESVLGSSFDKITEDEVDLKYKEAATKALLDKTVDDILKEDNGS